MSAGATSSDRLQPTRSWLRQLLRDIGGTIVRPCATLDGLAAAHGVRRALTFQCLMLLLGWGNVALFYVAGQNWLGTRSLLADPAIVTFMGYLHISLDDYVLFFVLFLPFLSLLGTVLPAGLAHILSKAWHGQGTFEQMVSTLVFALGVPGLVLATSSEILAGVPANLISGHPYWWVAAMNGEFGPVVGTLWSFYVIGVYAVGQYVWALVLGTVAIRRVQRIPWWGAVLTMVTTFALWMFVVSSYIR